MPNLITVIPGSGSMHNGTVDDDVFTVTGAGLAFMFGGDGNDTFNTILGDVTEEGLSGENEQFVNGGDGVDMVNMAVHSVKTATYEEDLHFTQSDDGNFHAAIFFTGVDPTSGNTYVNQWAGDISTLYVNDGQSGLEPPSGLSLPPTGFDYAVSVVAGGGDDTFELRGTYEIQVPNIDSDGQQHGTTPETVAATDAVKVDGGDGFDTVNYDVDSTDAHVVIERDGEAYVHLNGRWDHLTNVESVTFADGISFDLVGNAGDDRFDVDTTRATPYEINGGAGDDTVYFNNNWDSAFISTDSAGVTTVSYPARFNHGVDQTDRFVNVEHLVFSDGHVVDLSVASVPLSLTVVQTPGHTLEEGIDSGGVTVTGQDTAVAILVEKGTNAVYDMTGWTQTAPNSHQWIKQGTYGHATFTESSGDLYYSIDNTLPATNALAAGATAQEGFTLVLGNASGTVSKTVTFTVDGTNDAPILSGTQALLADGTEDTAYLLHATDLLSGFSDPESDAITLISVNADHGTIADNHDGTYSLTPTADYNGLVSMWFSASDSHGGIVNGWQYVTLSAVNDAPRLTGPQDSLTHGVMDHDYVVTAAALLSGYSDVENDALSLHNLSADHGTVTDNHDGTFTVHPQGGYSGAVALSYSIEDSHAAGTPVTRTVVLDSAGNHNPTAAGHTVTTSLNHAVTTTAAALLAGSADADSDTLTLASVGSAAHGTVTLNAAGNAVYTPYVSYTGADSYSYTLSDGHGGTATATVNVTVTGTTPSYTSGTSYHSGQTFDVSGDNAGHTVAGSAYDDTIYGGSQIDSLNGGGGNDVVHGGAGKDTVTGGAGYDQIYGDSGADTFMFAKADIADFTSNGGHYDQIMDFEGAGDGYHAGVGDFIRFNGFSGASTIALDAVKTAASSDATAHYYIITDGSYQAEIIVHYAGSAVLKAGDFGFYP